MSVSEEGDSLRPQPVSQTRRAWGQVPCSHLGPALTCTGALRIRLLHQPRLSSLLQKGDDLRLGDLITCMGRNTGLVSPGQPPLPLPPGLSLGRVSRGPLSSCSRSTTCLSLRTQDPLCPLRPNVSLKHKVST